MQGHYLIYFVSNAVTAFTAVFLYILMRNALRRKKKRQKLREEQAADPLRDAFTDKEKKGWVRKKKKNTKHLQSECSLDFWIFIFRINIDEIMSMI